jgi:hypothetical protein
MGKGAIIIGSILPGKLAFNGTVFQTARLNEGGRLITSAITFAGPLP